MRSAIFGVSVCLLLLAGGCGGGNVKAGGTVSFADGSSVNNGTVRFSNGQYQYEGTIQPDGTFRLGGLKPGDGLPPGTYQVSLFGVVEGDKLVLDERYELPDKSGISFEVVKGKAEPFKITVERSTVPRTAPQ